MTGTRILVADRARARLFDLVPALPRPGEASGPALVEIADITAPEGRLRPRELEADRPPSTHDRFGPGSHAIEPHTAPEDKQRARFARELCDLLEDGRIHRRFESLVVVATPRFLGALHAAMHAGLRACVTREIASELVDADHATLLAAIGASPPASARKNG